MFGVSLFMGLIASCINIAKYFVKENRVLLVGFMLTYLCFGFTYLLVDAYAGAIIFMLIGILFFATFSLQKNDEKYFYIMLVGFGILFLIGYAISSSGIINAIPLIVAFMFEFILFIQKREMKRVIIRILVCINLLLITIYSSLTGGYTIMISTICLLCFYIRDIYRFDIKKQVEPAVEIALQIKNNEEEKEKARKENPYGNVMLTSNLMKSSSKIRVAEKLNGRNIAINKAKLQNKVYRKKSEK